MMVNYGGRSEFELPLNNITKGDGFEEVSLANNDSNCCKTPVNELQEVTSFPKRESSNRVRGPFRRPRIGSEIDYSSSTDPSIGYKPWLSADDDFDQNGRRDGDKTPTSFDLADEDEMEAERRRQNILRTPSLVDELLSEIYARFGDHLSHGRSPLDSSRRASASGSQESDCLTEYSTTSEPGVNRHIRAHVTATNRRRDNSTLSKHRLKDKHPGDLRQECRRLETQIQYCMSQLTRQVKRRDRLRHRRERQYNLVTAILQASSQKRSQDTRIRFSLEPFPGDPGYVQWKDAMKMVARLPEGVPTEFRRKLWLTLSEKYLISRGVDWKKAERSCFNEWSNPDDDELGLQIVRDLHRTGCSLFCGEDAEANQLMLKRVLLAYARWNKSIGYCQGFNMLAAIILEVMEKAESDALKVMIFMIEGILPECYFTNNLRGLSVDMAVFRDLLKLRLPKLSKHLDDLQSDANDGCSAANFEPPLTNVFTMQWFLTLFSTCLPRDTVLRVWDLILLEGNEVLLRTALAIWKGLQERILLVKSADEFYSVMGQLSQEMLEFGTGDSNKLIKDLVEIAQFPFAEVPELREKYTYNITPWSQGIAVAKRGLRILYSDEEDNLDEDDEKIAVAATFGMSAVFRSPSKTSPAKPKAGGKMPLGPSQQNVDRERLTVDISALRQQYSKLRQRQKQAHIILTSAWNRNGGIIGTDNVDNSKPASSSSTSSLGATSTNSVPIAMNHLLLGKKPLVTSKPRRGPPPGAIPAPKKSQVNKLDVQQRNVSATHYSCPQPEVVSPSELKRGRHHRRSSKNKRSDSGNNSDQRDLSADESTGAAGRSRSASSSTETGCDGPAEDTENGTDVEDMLKDDVPPIVIDSEAQQVNCPTLKLSMSHHELSSETRQMDVKKIHSEADLLKFNEYQQRSALADVDGNAVNTSVIAQTENKEFLEELLKEFDKPATIYDPLENDKEEEEDTPEEATKSNEKALQIIQENYEILDKILKKKTGKEDIVPNNNQSICNDSLINQSNCKENPVNQEAKQQDKQRKVSNSSSSNDSSHCGSNIGITLQSNPATRPITFNPFPNSGRTRPNRKPKEVGRKLGLYPTK